MEQLLRDGGDLDSMDRSLLDYSAGRIGSGNNGGPNVVIRGHTSGDGARSPTYIHNHMSASTPPVSPVTPIPSPLNGTTSPSPPTSCQPIKSEFGLTNNCSANNSAQMSNLVKKDLVVRFTEFQNTVQHVSSATTSSERPVISNAAAEMTAYRNPSHASERSLTSQIAEDSPRHQGMNFIL